ncbi:hypothetical protein BC829DRAFT_445753 [Chytridium lagenaria]|nr:hypothetical protein BC829DRAFT_445753 [Chytridium lagenaria]
MRIGVDKIYMASSRKVLRTKNPGAWMWGSPPKRRNSAKLNKLDVQIQGLNWGDALTDVQDVDVVLGADVFYERENFEALVATLALLMRRSKSSCRAIIAYQERSSRRSIQELLDRFGLCARGIAKERLGWKRTVMGGSREVGRALR